MLPVRTPVPAVFAASLYPATIEDHLTEWPMLMLLSFVLVYGGIALYFLLLHFGIYRLFPIETYVLMFLGVSSALAAALRRGGWGRYAVVGLHGAVFLLILFWMQVYSRLPVHNLPVAVGQGMPSWSLADQDGHLFSTDSLRGKTAALYVFYRGYW